MSPNQVPLSKICLQCGEEYFKENKWKWERSNYCSNKCKNQAKVGKPSWNAGLKADREKYPTMGHFKPHTEETKELYRKINKEWIESLSPEELKEVKRKQKLSWIGDKAKYNSKHRWIQENWQKTGICQNCNKKTKPFGNRRYGTEWHNLDGEYNRDDKSTWLEVCPKCHKKLAKGEFKNKEKAA